MVRLLALVVLSLIFPSAWGFFSKVGALPRPSPSPSITVTKYHNITSREIRKLERESPLAALDSDDDSAKGQATETTTLASYVKRVLKWIGNILYSIKASCAVVAIQLVLSLKMEGMVLQRLPVNLLLFLLEVSIHRPAVLQSVARELGERISTEICKFTGKEKYQVGDITKTIVAQYTGKEEYQFGDLARATLSKFSWMRRQQQKQLSRRNEEVRGKISQSDQRKHVDDNKKKRSAEEMESLLFKITGKKDYEFGDVTRAVLKKLNSKDR